MPRRGRDAGIAGPSARAAAGPGIGRGAGAAGRLVGRAGVVVRRRSWSAGWVMILALLGAADSRAEPWSTVFAGEPDSAFFLFGDGTLVRAPFSLRTADTLWRCPEGQHVVRMLGSPSGARLAFTSRGIEADTTRLWIASPQGVELRLRFFSLQARRHGQQYSEISWLTSADETASGARLLSPTFRPHGPSANALAWTPDGGSLYVGFDGGIAGVTAGRRGVSRMSGHRALRLRPLRPSAFIEVDALDSASASSRSLTQFDLEHALDTQLSAKDGRVGDVLERRRMLLAPAGGALHECAAGDWLRAGVRAAGASGLWWAAGRSVVAFGDACGPPAPPIRAPGPVDWLGYDAARGRLMGVSGRVLWHVAEDGGEIARAARTASRVRAVLRAVRGRSVALVVKDSVIVWNASTDEVRRLGYSGPPPEWLFEGWKGALVLAVGSAPGRPASLARAAPGDVRFAPVPVPRAARSGTLLAGPRGAWVLSCELGLRVPERLHAFDVEAGSWHVVENPGITAWEPLAP